MLDDTIDELRTVALDATDATGHFPAMYARVTDRVRGDVASGRFTDGETMVEFARAFASWYLRPLSGDVPLPGSWRAASDVASDGRLLIVQHLLLGINAHVNHDLPQVVVELAERRGELAALRHDFDTINDVLAETMPFVLRDLARVSRWVNLAAARGGKQLFKFSLTAARRQAWRSAVLLEPLDRAASDAAAAELDRAVRVLAYLITEPARPFSWLVPFGRRLEEHDPRRVTRSLLGHLA
jgi:hypothetical protein